MNESFAAVQYRVRYYTLGFDVLLFFLCSSIYDK